MRLTALAMAAAMAGAAGAQPVSYERLVNALSEQRNWLTYWGDYTAGCGTGNSNRSTPATVKDLRVEWMFQTGQTGAFETVPIVVDGVMYITAGNGVAFALDARSGRRLWEYKHAFPTGEKANGVNRGFAILGDRLFMVTPDAHLVALEAKTGRLVWESEMAPLHQGPVHGHARAFGGEEQDYLRHFRRGVRDPGLRRCLRCRNRQARLAFLGRSRQGRAGRRYLAGRFLAARRRVHLDDGHLRPEAEHALLGHRESRPGTSMARTAWATTCTPIRWWRSIRTRAK